MKLIEFNGKFINADKIEYLEKHDEYISRKTAQDIMIYGIIVHLSSGECIKKTWEIEKHVYNPCPQDPLGFPFSKFDEKERTKAESERSLNFKKLLDELENKQ